MKKLTLPVFLSMTVLASFAQNRFLIHGKVDLLTKSKYVRLSGYAPVAIGSDGGFEIAGEISQPNTGLIMTDSSGASAVWLTPGEYSIKCSEITLPGHHGILLRTPTLKGPADAELYNDFQNQQYSGFGGRDRAVQYMDSILKTNNTTPALPNMIRSVQRYVGEETTKLFIQKLSSALRNDPEIVMVENGFKRKEKLATEKVFENFTLIDTAGRNFSLVSLSGKKAILVDFWASSCGPCRVDHPQLKQWYAKYAAKGLQIVSISIDENKAAWLKAVHDDGIGSWVNVCDPHGFEATLMKDYYIPYIPFRFLLDGNRNIVLVNNMEDSWITEKDIAALLEVR